MSTSSGAVPMNMPRRLSYEGVEDWLVNWIARIADLEVEDVDIDRPFIEFQLDSSAAVTLAQQLADFSGAQIGATVFWEQPCIRALAEFLAGPQGCEP